MDVDTKLGMVDCFTMRLLKVFPEEHCEWLLRKVVSKREWCKLGTYIFAMSAPIIYVLCAFVGWGFSPAEWGVWIRAVGVSLMVLIEFVLFGLVLFYLQEMRDWVARYGVGAFCALRRMQSVPTTEQEMAEFICGLGKEQNS